MKKYIVIVVLLLVIGIFPLNAQAVSFSSTNRLKVSVQTDFSTELLPATSAPVYQATFTNVASKQGASAFLSAIDFGYRSLDLKYDEVKSFSVYQISPKIVYFGTVDINPNQEYFTAWFTGSNSIVIPPNESVTLVLYANLNSELEGAVSGDKFRIYITDISVGEYQSGNLIRYLYSKYAGPIVTVI